MISDLTKAGLTAATAGVSSQLIVMAQEYNGKADAVEAVSKALPPVAVIVALAVCMLAFPPAVLAQPQSVGELLVGKAAFGDWRTDAPMVRRKITDLPAPYATRSASNPPRVIGKPISATPQVPPGFQVELFASNLHDPRTIRVAPNGDIFIAESEPGGFGSFVPPTVQLSPAATMCSHQVSTSRSASPSIRLGRTRNGYMSRTLDQWSAFPTAAATSKRAGKQK